MPGRISREQFGKPDSENSFQHGKVQEKGNKGGSNIGATFKGASAVNNAASNGFGEKWNAPSGGFSNKKRPSGLA